MRVTQLSHIAMQVRDLDASIEFYTQVIGLELMPRPAFKHPGLWFRIGLNQSLHLVAHGQMNEARHEPLQRHFALRVNDISAAAAHLRLVNYPFTGPTMRPDGLPEIFLRDPDGHVIEICGDPC